jgi:hypothetical protein
MSETYARELLSRMLEVHDMQQKNVANDYESVRRIRKQSNTLFEEVRAFLSRGEVQVPTAPAVLLKKAKRAASQ